MREREGGEREGGREEKEYEREGVEEGENESATGLSPYCTYMSQDFKEFPKVSVYVKRVSVCVFVGVLVCVRAWVCLSSMFPGVSMLSLRPH